MMVEIILDRFKASKVKISCDGFSHEEEKPNDFVMGKVVTNVNLSVVSLYLSPKHVKTSIPR